MLTSWDLNTKQNGYMLILYKKKKKEWLYAQEGSCQKYRNTL